jgi:AraC-like DNA-binding protein
MNQKLTFPLDYGWLIRSKDLNLNDQEIRAKAGLSFTLSDSGNNEITVDEFYKVFEAVQSLFPDKIYALEFEKVWTVESFSLIHYAILHSRNLKESFKRLNHFENIYGPEKLSISENKTEFIVDIDFLPSVVEVPSVLIEFAIISYVKLARLGTRKNLKPLSVFTTKDIDAQAYYNYLGVYPKKGEVNKIVFSKEDAEYPFVTYDENLWKIHEQALQVALDQKNKNISYSVKVQSALLQLLPSGKYSIEDIAEKLNVSKRTLQRNLSAENTNYSEQLENIREQRARYYLEKTDSTYAEISFLLGYDHPKSFSRAFVKWTGLNPESFRN